MKNDSNKNKITFWTKALYTIVAFFVRIALNVAAGFKLYTDPLVKEWKRSGKGFIILCAHPSEMDAVVLLSSAFPRYARFVVGAQQLYKNNFQSRMLRWFKVIPKKQFVSDLHSIKEMMRTVKNGMVLGMMPEGRVSLDGTPNPIEESTAKLIKKLGVPVAVLIPHGTYFVKPPYNYKGVILGKMSGELKALFTPEDIKIKTEEEIYSELLQAVSYNASEELRGSGNTYGSNKTGTMKNVENLLYLCPSCLSEYSIRREKDELVCKCCGAKVSVSKNMFFTSDNTSMPDSIASWNKIQLKHEEDFWQESDAELVFNVKESMLAIGSAEDYSDLGSGTLKLSGESLSYNGSGEDLQVPIKLIPGVSADYQFGCIMYYKDNDIRKFTFEDKKSVAKFVNALMVLKKKEPVIL